MVAALFDRVKETTTTTGTGAITLAGAPTGFRTFASVLVDGSSVPYVIEHGANWEVGRGTYHSGPNTLSRTTVEASSNAGSLVNFGSGTKQVAITNSVSLHKLAEQSDVLLTTVSRGDILYRGATEWNNLVHGSTGQLLQSNGAGADPTWVTPTPGITDHGALTGLGDDDHPQYHNDARGDARYSPLGHNHDSRYYTESEVDLALAAVAATIVTDHGNLTGLGDDDHSQYFNQTRGDARYALLGSGVTDHGALTGLADDDHLQYHTDARGDARYSLLGHTHSFASLTSKPTTISGYGITDAFTQTAADALYSPLGHTHTFASLTSKPTTLVGYGITDAQPLDATLTALAAFNTNGLLTQTATDTFTGRTITGTASRLSVSNGNGVSGNPTLDIDATYVGQTSITTLGTIATGVWSGTAIGPTKGGTGLATYAQGDILYSSAANTLAALAAGTDGKILTTRGAAANPSWGTLAVGTAGTDFAYSYAAGTHTFNLPDASATARGVVTTGAQTLAGVKTFSGNMRIGTATTADALADVLIGTSATTQKGLVIQGKASQTANLQEWQYSSGSKLAAVLPDAAPTFRIYNIADGSDWLEFGANLSSLTYIRTGANGGGTPKALIIGASAGGIYIRPQTVNVNGWQFNSSSHFLPESDNGFDIGTTSFRVRSIYTSGNLGFGQTTFGTSAAKVLAIGSGTAPSTSPADAVQMWSADRGGTAGKASLHLRTEDGTSHVFGDRVGIGTLTPATAFEVVGVSTFDANPIVTNTAPGVTFTDTTASAKSLTIAVDSDRAQLRESAGASGSLMVLDLTYNRVAIGTTDVGGPTQGSPLTVQTNSVGYSIGTRGNSSDQNSINFATFADGTLAYTYINADGRDTGYLAFSTNDTERLKIDSAGNLLIGTSTAAASMVGGIGMKSGTVPTGNVADCFQLYSADQTAGNACPFIRTENSAIIKLFQAPAIADTTGAILLSIETEVNKLKQLLRNNGLLAA